MTDEEAEAILSAPVTKGEFLQAMVAVQGVTVKIFGMVLADRLDNEDRFRERMKGFDEEWDKFTNLLKVIGGWEGADG